MYMINLTGMTVIICGFIIPHFVGRQVSFFFFCAGFLLLLWPSAPLLKNASWPKWARIGVLLNIIVTIFFAVLVILEQLSLFRKLNFILHPVSPLFDFLFPKKIPDEKIIFDSFRSTIIIFFDIIMYIALGVIIGKLISSRGSGSVMKQLVDVDAYIA